MRKKLCSSKGETMMEALVSVLLVSIVSAAMVGMISSASRLNREAEEMDEALYSAISAAETGSTVTDKNGTVTVKVDDELDGVDVSVKFYGSTEEEIYSYEVQ